jgi:hypothetical protein
VPKVRRFGRPVPQADGGLAARILPGETGSQRVRGPTSGQGRMVSAAVRVPLFDLWAPLRGPAACRRGPRGAHLPGLRAVRDRQGGFDLRRCCERRPGAQRRMCARQPLHLSLVSPPPVGRLRSQRGPPALLSAGRPRPAPRRCGPHRCQGSLLELQSSGRLERGLARCGHSSAGARPRAAATGRS